MKKIATLCWLFAIVLLSACKGQAQSITITGTEPEYKIVLPVDASKIEQRAAGVLQEHIERIAGVRLQVIQESRKMGTVPGLYIGNTSKSEEFARLPTEAYHIKTIGTDVMIRAGSGRGIMYGVYTFLEKYLDCRKLDKDVTMTPGTNNITIPAHIDFTGKPGYIYREVYYPAPEDAAYLEWHKLQRFEDLWGLWGHSYFKLVPPQQYFKAHPEYYSLVDGKRQALQLCLSNDQVFNIAVAELRKRMADNPDAIYWSVSANDDIGNCECNLCKAADDEQGTPAGSLIRFVNRIAAVFPDKKFTTLAYGFTHRAPRTLAPAKNVYIFLTTIDAFRDQPLTTEPSAATFRNDVKGWSALTPNLFVWDYITQFTNYLAPFPNLHTLQPNIRYFKESGIKGIFAQGSGNTYSEWAELRCYLTARLLDDEQADVNQLIAGFMTDYYGPAAKYLQEYQRLLEENMRASKRKLDIYGNPVNEWNSYLTPDLLDQYSTLIDKAEGAVEGNAKFADRVMRVRLSLDYTVLQQARFYGIEKYGIFVKDKEGNWIVREMIAKAVKRFVANCHKAGVRELAEGGSDPDAYNTEWNEIFKNGVTPTMALQASVTLQHTPAPEYPAKGPRTLVDGNPGYKDFSYNWLCFYGVPMVATVDLGSAMKVSAIKMHFLDDPRHWIFLPPTIRVEVSADGVNYRSIADIKQPALEEHYETEPTLFTAVNKTSQQVRYIRVTAQNLEALPSWRFRQNKKPMIACDEIFVQ